MKHAVVGAIASVVAFGCSSSSSLPSSAGAPVAPVSHATGALSGWLPLTDMTTPRANHCSVALGDWLVVIGGNYKPAGKKDFVNNDDVLVAKIAADGTIGDWHVAGTTPSPVNSCTAAADGNDLYLVDGIFDDQTAGGKVRRATLDEHGALSAWTEVGSLPDGVRVLYSSATVEGGELRAFTAKLPDSGDSVSMLRAPLTQLDGWEQSDWLKGFRGHPQYAFARSFVYALGGYGGGDNGVFADGAAARLDASGAPGQSFPVAKLPKPTAFGQAIAVDDWIFVVGGKDDIFQGKGRADVFAAHVADDGTLGDFTTVASLPQGRTSHAVALHGDFLYVTGGGYDAGGLATVFAARVRTAE
jgi:hypothetical protein